VAACVGIQEVRRLLSELVIAMKTVWTESVLSKQEQEVNTFWIHSLLFYTPYWQQGSSIAALLLQVEINEGKQKKAKQK
jgi:hypothetical protein